MIKNKWIYLLCTYLVFSITAFAQGKQLPASQYIISGNIAGLTSAKIYLSSNEGEEKFLDSTISKEGRFNFKGKIIEPMFYSIRIEGVRGGLGIFLEKGNMTIAGHKDSLYKAIVKGSKSNDQWREWGKAWSAITVQAGPMYKRLDSATKAGAGKPSPEERKIFDDGMQSLNEQTKTAVTSFIKKYPTSPVGPFIIIDRFINYPNPEMEVASFALLADEAKNSLYGKKITEYRRIAAKTGIGATPDFAIADTSGKVLKLSDLRGKYVLVDFWASWCAPCRKENPNVVKAYQQYHSKGFEIVGVTLDTKKDAWMKAIYMDKLEWNHVGDLNGWESDIVKEFGIKVVPTSFLLDKEGKVIANNLREEALQKKLAELFN